MHNLSYAIPRQTSSNVRAERFSSVDVVRGIAMVFMLFHHSTWHIPLVSFRVNFGWDILLPPLQAFFNPYLWLGLFQGTPLFFIMAGFSVAFFEQARRKTGWTEWQITRYLLIRGGVLIVIDWLVLPWQFYPELVYEPTAYFVLTSIGICLWLIAFIRLLPLKQLLFMVLSLTLTVQVLYHFVHIPLNFNLSRTVLLYMSPLDPIDFGFPVLPWLCVILLGYMTMRYLHANPQHFLPLTLAISVTAWVIWLTINAINSFGILFPLHPLIMTKHPPSLAYLTFYIGMAYLLLGLLYVFRSLQKYFPLNHLALLGQVAFIFYILHFYAIDLFSGLLHNSGLHPMTQVLLITTLSLLLLYAVCTRYRLIRKAYPDSLLKYL